MTRVRGAVPIGKLCEAWQGLECASATPRAGTLRRCQEHLLLLAGASCVSARVRAHAHLREHDGRLGADHELLRADLGLDVVLGLHDFLDAGQRQLWRGPVNLQPQPTPAMDHHKYSILATM